MVLLYGVEREERMADSCFISWPFVYSSTLQRQAFASASIWVGANSCHCLCREMHVGVIAPDNGTVLRASVGSHP